jgi:hypothetical protein
MVTTAKGRHLKMDSWQPGKIDSTSITVQHINSNTTIHRLHWKLNDVTHSIPLIDHQEQE